MKKTVYKNDRVTVYSRENQEKNYHTVGISANAPCNGVNVIAYNRKTDKFLFVIQRRAVFDFFMSIETPRGGLEPNESPEEGASRELFEETGFVIPSDRMSLVAKISPDTGLLDDYLFHYSVFITDEEMLEHKFLKNDETEEHVWLNIREFLDHPLNKELKCGISLAGIFAFMQNDIKNNHF